jgi:hypothetical protein
MGGGVYSREHAGGRLDVAGQAGQLGAEPADPLDVGAGDERAGQGVFGGSVELEG